MKRSSREGWVVFGTFVAAEVVALPYLTVRV